MKTATTVCGRCGAKISDDATGQVCPACLLEMGLGLLDDDSVAEVDLPTVAAYSAEAAAKAGSTKADDPSYVQRKGQRHALPIPFSCSSFATRYWLKGETRKAFIESLTGGKTASRSLLREFIDGVGDQGACNAHAARIHHKQVARAVTGQTLRAVRHGAKDRSTVPT